MRLGSWHTHTWDLAKCENFALIKGSSKWRETEFSGDFNHPPYEDLEFFRAPQPTLLVQGGDLLT